MKKFYMILAAIAALTMTAQAQETGIINVGDIDNPTEIYNGSYFDMAPTNFYVAHTGAQMIYTPDMLADMEGKQNVKIENISFKFNSESFETIVRNVKIYLKAIDETEFAVNQDGIKQFFDFGELVQDGQYEFDLLSNYGDDMEFVIPVESFAFTPGKSLLVTIIFDAEDDDNCTMGSDYAPFYTSGVRGKAMTFTNNWTSFLDYAQGNDFPNATAMLGCGTNVELPVTKIVYTYENAISPNERTDSPSASKVNYVYDVNGEYYNAYTVTLTPAETEPDCTIWYRIGIMQDGQYVFDQWTEYVAPFDVTDPGNYRIEAYAITNGKLESYPIADEFVVSKLTDVEEMFAGKTVANVRYFNVAGQEMQQANGLTIVVTTFTDGTTSAVKVVK